METNSKPKFQNVPVPETVEYFMRISTEECVNLTEREVKCPYCHFPLTHVFSDASGHLRVKCPKCKGTAIVNLAYFYTSKSKTIGRLKVLEQNQNQ